MRGTHERVLLALASLAALLLLAGAGTAAAPNETSWSPLTLEGPPVDAGFLAEGFIVYATEDAGTTSGLAGAECSVDADDADLFLVSFPDGPGCRQAIDTSGAAEGTTALATATSGTRAIVALPIDGAQPLAGDNLIGYQLTEGNLSEDWQRQLDGEVIDLATDPQANRVVATFQADGGNYRVQVLSGSGARIDSFGLPGQPRSLAISENARFLALGGNVTEGDSMVGWAHLYDLSSDDEEPVIDRTIPRPRAGIVESTAVSDEGTFYAGLFDGTLRQLRENGNDRERAIGTDAAQVAIDDGIVFAAAGNQTARVTVDEGELVTRWQRTVNGTSRDVIAKAPYVFTVAEALRAFSLDGEPIWETTAGSIVAANETARGLALASEGASGTSSASQLEGRTLQAELSFEQTAPIVVSPGAVNRSEVLFVNDGAAILNLTPTLTDEGLRAHTNPASFDVLPGQTANVSITVEAQRDASPGQRSAPLELAAQPPVPASFELEVEVTSRPDIRLSFAGGEVGDRDVTQGQTVTTRLDLRNRGNDDANVNLDVLQSVATDWPVDISPNATVSVPGGSLTTAEITITVPEQARNGTENRLIMRSSSDQGISAVQLNLTVNPFHVIRVQPATLAQDLAPGETKPYNLSIENLGSIDADVQVSLQAIDARGDACIPTEWGLSLSRSRLTVPASDQRPVRVEITAPAEIPVPGVENGTAGCTEDAQRPTLRVELAARSQEDSRDESLLFANVDPSLQRSDEEENEQPLPVWGLIAALLAAAALTHHRGAKP